MYNVIESKNYKLYFHTNCGCITKALLSVLLSLSYFNKLTQFTYFLRNHNQWKFF